jgi:hypothetical protein
VNVQLLRVHEYEAVGQIIDDAYDLALAKTQDPAEWQIIFGKAVDLLAARLPVQPQQVNAPVDLSRLKLQG